MISVFWYFVEREFTDDVRSGAVTDDSMGLQLHWRIIKEFVGVRQYLADKCDPVIGFHGFDFHIDVHIARPEQKLPRWCADPAYAGKHWLVVSVKNQRRNELPEAADSAL